MTDTCEFIKENGERCGSFPIKGDTFCINHSKTAEAMRIKAAAVRKGGKVRSRPDGIKDWQDMTLGTPAEVSKLLELVINAAVRGDIATQRAGAVSSLCSTMNKSLELGTIDERLKVLEKAILNKES